MKTNIKKPRVTVSFCSEIIEKVNDIVVHTTYLSHRLLGKFHW